MYRQILRNRVHVYLALVMWPVGLVLWWAWSSTDYETSSETRWLMVPVLAAAVAFAGWIVDWRAATIPTGVSWSRIGVAVAIAGTIAGGAGYGATGRWEAAALLAVTVAFASGAFGVAMRVKRRIFEQRYGINR